MIQKNNNNKFFFFYYFYYSVTIYFNIFYWTNDDTRVYKLEYRLDMV